MVHPAGFLLSLLPPLSLTFASVLLLSSFSTPPPPCSPLRPPSLYSSLRLSTPLSPLASIPNITLACVYIMVGHGGRVGEVSPLSAKGGGVSRFFPSRNVLCVSRSERGKNALTESASALSVRAPLSPYLDDECVLYRSASALSVCSFLPPRSVPDRGGGRARGASLSVRS